MLRKAARVASLALVAVFASGCPAAGPAAPAAGGVAPVGSGRPPIPVAVATARRDRVVRAVPLVGTLHGDEEATLSNKVVSRIQRIGADVGDVVSGGAVVAELDPRDFELALAATRRALETVLARLGLGAVPGDAFDPDGVATVARARAELENAKVRLGRLRELEQQSRGFVADQTLKDAETSVAVWTANVDAERLNARALAAEARQRAADLEVARRRLAECRILTPEGERAWSVTARLVSEGEYLKEGTPLFRVVASNPLKLRAAASERHVADFRVGQEARVRVEAFGDRVFPGRVSRVNPSVDPANRTFGVEILVPNPGGELYPGSFARADVLTREATVLEVPIESIVSFAGVQKVFVLEKGEKGTVAREVVATPGERHDRWIEVVAEGLPEGASVVVRGQTVLSDGQRVQLADPAGGKAPQGDAKK